ncbi:MAG: ankyrin repeat domain-containing protein, partial [Myxococcaceae bacterium]
MQQAVAMVQDAFTAARSGDVPSLRELLGRGVPADVLNGKGDSLLMLAAYHGHQEATRLLLERGADPELRNGRGQT